MVNKRNPPDTDIASLKVVQILRNRWKVAITGSPDHDAIMPALKKLMNAGKIEAWQETIDAIEKNFDEFSPEVNHEMLILLEWLQTNIKDERRVA